MVLTALVISPMPGMAAGDDMPGHPVRRVGEPEERDAVAVAGVEEEVLPRAAGQVQRLDQRHTEHVAVEVDGARHVRAHQRDVVDAAELELGVGVVRLDHPGSRPSAWRLAGSVAEIRI